MIANYDMTVDGEPICGWQALADDYKMVLGFFFGDKYTIGKAVDKDGKGFEVIDHAGNVHGWITQNKDNGCTLSWNPDRPKQVVA